MFFNTISPCFGMAYGRIVGRCPSGVVYSIMKKTRSTYHYMLRALKKKKKHYKTKISLSKSMLRSNNGTYWK